MKERRAHPPRDSHDIDGLVRHVALANWLVLAVVVLYHVVAPEFRIGGPLLGAMAAFAAAGLLVRAPGVFGRRPVLKLVVQPWVGVAFVTVVLGYTGGADSPLVSLYLVPIVLGALVLPRTWLALLVVAVAVGYVAVAAWGSGLEVASPAFAGRAFGVVGPYVLVAWLTAQLGSALLSARRRATELTETDSLTGLANRRAFEDALAREHELAARRRTPYGVLIADLDGLGRLNRESGPQAGDAALVLVANVLKRTIREVDLPARWGGDEFAVLLPGADVAAANAVGQRLKSAVYAATLSVGARVVRCAVHVGAAAGPHDGHEPRDLVGVAELRLRQERELQAQIRPVPG